MTSLYITPSLGDSASRENEKVSIVLLAAGLLSAVFVAAWLNSTAAWALCGLCVAGLVAVEPRLGLYGLAASITLDSVTYDPITAPFAFAYRPLPSGLLFTPIEALALLTLGAWIVSEIAHGRKLVFPDRQLAYAGAGLSALLIFGIEQGVSNGGDFRTSIWETRGLLIIFPVILLSCGLLKTKRQVIEFGAVLSIALVLMSIETAWRYFTIVRPGDFDGVLENAFNHDGAMMVGFTAIMGAAGAIWAPSGRGRLLSALVFILAGFVVLSSRRRAAVIGTEAGMLALAMMLAATNWRRFAKVAPFVLVVSICYMAAFWNSENTLGQPVRGFRTVFDSSAVSQRDQSSDLYRQVEKQNLWIDIEADPLTGTGFGLPFAKPIPMVDLSDGWPFWDYIPHNNILWLWLKGGILAIFGLLFLVGSQVSRCITMARLTKRPMIVALLAGIGAYMVMMLMFAYVDLGLTSTRLMILMGALIGLLPVLERMWIEPELAEEAALDG